MSELNLSPSQMAAFTGCARKWGLGYVKNFKEFGKPAPDFGTAFHRGVDVLYDIALNPSSWEDWSDPAEGAAFHAKKAFDVVFDDLQPDSDDWRSTEMGHAMLDGYAQEYFHEIAKVDLIGSEESFKVAMAPSVNLVGRIDKVYRHPDTGKVTVLDTKTASAYSKEHGLQPTYWEIYLQSHQVSAYIYAANFIYGEENVGDFIVDACLAHPKHTYFERRSFTRTPKQLEAFRLEFLEIAEAMQRVKERGVFARNLGECKSWGGCVMRPLCVQVPVFADVPDMPPDWLHGVRYEPRSHADEIAKEAS